ncbi:unnamed protein product [Cladocopium goreaui]|uniref:Uncharacterized protein n=1 Tax=Cladocopium goreaui TaxID=2562237 RepID=A0A9P1GFF2_9DINO|nr:unnamed protein product [Cladocopium goreaui]
MHIVHLALGVDAVASVLIDMCDYPNLIEGFTRDDKLSTLYANYREWCEATSVADRAARKFFTTGVLRPQGGAQYPAVSQKILSATACRYLIFWLSRALQQIVLDDDIYKHPVNDSLN